MRVRSHFVVIVIASSVSASLACVSPMAARRAEVLQPGEVRAGVSLGGSFDFSRTRIEAGDSSQTRELTTGPNLFTGSGQPALWLGALSLDVGAGVGAGCDANASIGVSRMGVLARCNVLDEHTHAAPSVTATLGGYWLPFGGGEVVGGFDVGHDFGAGHAALTNLTVSYGDYPHGVQLPNDLGGAVHDNPLLRFHQREVRVSAAVGAQVRVGSEDDGGVALLTLAAVPWMTLWSAPPELRSCDFCSSGVALTDHKQGYGIGLVFGATAPFGARR